MSPAADVICLLDDEPSVLRAFGRLLASAGLESEQFTEPDRFLDYARSHPVRLAVVDVHMPGMSGLEVQTALRTLQPAAGIIVMSATENANNRDAALAGGAAAFLLKPVEDDQFLDTIHAALRRPVPPN